MKCKSFAFGPELTAGNVLALVAVAILAPMQAARTLAAEIEEGSEPSSTDELRTSLVGSTAALLADDDTRCCEADIFKLAFQRRNGGRAEDATSKAWLPFLPVWLR